MDASREQPKEAVHLSMMFIRAKGRFTSAVGMSSLQLRRMNLIQGFTIHMNMVSMRGFVGSRTSGRVFIQEKNSGSQLNIAPPIHMSDP